MNVIKLKPAIKDYLWGGTNLIKAGKEANGDKIAECWEFSFHKDGLTRVESTGQPLCEVVSEKELGEKIKQFNFFPFLIKLIDSDDNLSVQVHPSDSYALKNEKSLGKTEMWYILDAKPNCGIYAGFKNKETKKSVLKSINDGTIMEKLNFYKVKPGECYFIQSGTIHAIGKGVTLIEIQQNSNLTYRLFDYNRMDKNGNKRPLHIEKALKVIRYKPYENKIRQLPLLGKCKYFKSYLFDESNNIIKTNKHTFSTITFIEGSGSINGIAYKKYDTFFIPCNTKVEITGICKYVLTKI